MSELKCDYHAVVQIAAPLTTDNRLPYAVMLMGCDHCGFRHSLGERARMREIIAAEQRHHEGEPDDD